MLTELKIKPKWEDAPSWAEYLSQDDSGSWYWFEFVPTFNVAKGTWNSDEGRWISHSNHLVESRIDNGTLERRP